MSEFISGAVDAAMVFGMLFVLMVLPVLMFKRAFSSKRDVDYLDASKFVPVPDPMPTELPEQHPMMGATNAAYAPAPVPTNVPNAMSVARSEDAWSYFTAARDLDISQGGHTFTSKHHSKHHNGHHKA